MWSFLKRCNDYSSAPLSGGGGGGGGLERNDKRRDSQRRWSLATKKIKSLIAVSDAINMKERNKLKSRSFQQKNSFLDKFSTRDRLNSNVSFDNLRRRETNVPSQNMMNLNGDDYFNNDLADDKINVTCDDECYKENSIQLLKILFEPYSPFIYVWSWIIITTIHYNSWVMILRVAFFDAQCYNNTLWFCLDYTADFIYLIDILISSRMSFLENGIYVDSVKRVSLRYLKSLQFLLDFLSVIPTDILYMISKINPIYRVPRLIKFLKVFKSKKLIESMTNFPNMIRGVFWLHVMFLLIHWNSCLFYIISEYEGFGSNKWVYPSHNHTESAIVHRYIKCMYWSTLVLTTIGESNPPETTIECFYMIICYITGIFIFATIVGQAGNVIQNIHSSRMDFEKKRDNMMQHMKNHKVPTHLQKRVRLWYDYTYSRGRINGGEDINENTMLPDKMKTELALHVHLETLRKVSFLQKCQPEFLHDLVLKMKLHIFTPGDFIVRKGEIAREMYVISDGIAEVLSENGRVLKVLHSGDFFGEIGLLKLSAGKNRRTADVRSCGYIELFVLSKDDVMSSITDYPEAQLILSKHGRKRLALESVDSPGLRDETTSGSPSDSDEIEVTVTGPDSSNNSVNKKTKDKSSVICNGKTSHTNHLSVDSVHKMDDPFENSGTPTHIDYSTKHRTLHNTVSSISNQSNVIGPASQMKHVQSRSILRREKSKAKDEETTEDDDQKRTDDFLLKRRNLRRSNTDIRRKRKTISGKRCTYSESGLKRSTYSEFGVMNSPIVRKFIETTIINQHFQDRQNSPPSELDFIKSMKEMYMKVFNNPSKQENSQYVEQNLQKLEQMYYAYQKERDKSNNEKEEQLKKELFHKEKEVCNITDVLHDKEEEFKDKEMKLTQQLQAMESQGKELKERLEIMESKLVEKQKPKETVIHL